jgi:uncharacterized membrane protein
MKRGWLTEPPSLIDHTPYIITARTRIIYTVSKTKASPLDSLTPRTTMIVWIVALGFATGLRTMTPIAVLCWFAYTQRLHLAGTWGFWAATIVAVILFTIAALGEYIGDKLPKTPNRTDAFPLASRAIFGGLCGALVATALHEPIAAGIIPGALGALLGSYAGYWARRVLVRNSGLPPMAVAIVEVLLTILIAFEAVRSVTLLPIF